MKTKPAQALSRIASLGRNSMVNILFLPAPWSEHQRLRPSYTPMQRTLFHKGDEAFRITVRELSSSCPLLLLAF